MIHASGGSTSSDHALAIRPLRASDADDCARIFFHAVHAGARNVYSYHERLAWAGPKIDRAAWRARMARLEGFVAETAGGPVGFMTIDGRGYVEFGYVDPTVARKGIGAALLNAVEARAKGDGARELRTHASLAARAFFERHGWRVSAEEAVLRHGVALRRYDMCKPLDA